MQEQDEATGGDGASSDPPMVMMAREQYAPYRWVQAAVALLAIWLVTSPFSLGYAFTAAGWNDVACGAVALALSIFALSPGARGALSSWAMSIVGIWLLLAPLVFWTESAAAYGNDTLVGALFIAFAFLIPMSMKMHGPEIPRGWSYNPSSWPQRAPLIALAFVGFLCSRYMAAYQLGYIDTAWDPFFGDGTRRILDSDVSRMWPVSDAGLGAAVYMIEMLSGLMGDSRRWRTMPWMVAIFGLAVVPLGIVSIVLVILQPLAVGSWCTLCLVSAAAMLAMIPLALDEIVAMLQFVRAQKMEHGRSYWSSFWLGGDLPEDTPTAKPERPVSWRPRGMVYGVTSPIPLIVSIALGVWLMFSPTIFGARGAAADSDHLVGALVIVFAAIALAEVARSVRFLNIAAGAWLVLGPWFLSGAAGGSRWNDAIAGAVLIMLSLPLGSIRQRYGSFNPLVRWPRQRSGKPTSLAHVGGAPAGAAFVAVVTGASAGVGRAVVRELARRGARIGLIARGRDGLEAAAREVRELGGTALVAPADVADAAQVERAASEIEAELGPIDVWVNNAMASVFSPALDTTPEEYERVTRVTYLGYVWGTLAALRRMRERDRGVVVQVGSALAYRSIPLQSAYCAAKHAIQGFTESLRSELLHDRCRVRVTTVHLPAINTPQFEWVRSRLPNRAQPVPPIFQPEVAARAIVHAALHPRRELWVGWPTVRAIIGDRLVPGLLDRYLARVGYRGQQTDEPAPARPRDNLLEPLPGDAGAHGRFDARARGTSVQLWLSMHRRALAVASLALIALAMIASLS